MTMTIMPAAEVPAPAYGRRKLFRFVLFVLSGILAAIAFAMPSRASESQTLIIPPNDGYGFEECLKAGTECGTVVADAWCKAHGFGASKGYGPETDGAAAGSIQVTCGDRVN